jgi:hypothetical protein
MSRLRPRFRRFIRDKERIRSCARGLIAFVMLVAVIALAAEVIGYKGWKSGGSVDGESSATLASGAEYTEDGVTSATPSGSEEISDFIADAFSAASPSGAVAGGTPDAVSAPSPLSSNPGSPPDAVVSPTPAPGTPGTSPEPPPDAVVSPSPPPPGEEPPPGEQPPPDGVVGPSPAPPGEEPPPGVQPPPPDTVVGPSPAPNPGDPAPAPEPDDDEEEEEDDDDERERDAAFLIFPAQAPGVLGIAFPITALTLAVTGLMFFDRKGF